MRGHEDRRESGRTFQLTRDENDEASSIDTNPIRPIKRGRRPDTVLERGASCPSCQSCNVRRRHIDSPNSTIPGVSLRWTIATVEFEILPILSRLLVPHSPRTQQTLKLSVPRRQDQKRKPSWRRRWRSPRCPPRGRGHS